MSPVLEGALLVESVMAALVSCADASGGGAPVGWLRRLGRAVLWMVTVPRWIVDRDTARLARFAAVVWFLVITGWLLTLLYDRAPRPVFPVGVEVLMAFVVFCVDAFSGNDVGHPLRRAVRAVFWPPTVVGYMRASDSVGIAQASLTVWILLTTGWLLALAADRILRPLGLLGA